jgi:hypothetical protein
MAGFQAMQEGDTSVTKTHNAMAVPSPANAVDRSAIRPSPHCLHSRGHEKKGINCIRNKRGALALFNAAL